MKTPSQKQTDLLMAYSRLMVTVDKKADPLAGLPSGSGLACNLRNSQHQLYKLFYDNPDLSLRPYFVMNHEGKEYVSIPRITVCAYLLGRLRFFDESCCMLSLLTRVCFQACRDYQVQSYVVLVKIMTNQQHLRWVGDADDINPHLSLSKTFLEKLYGTSIGIQPTAPLKFLPVTNTFKPATTHKPASTITPPRKGFYSNRFKLKF